MKKIFIFIELIAFFLILSSCTLDEVTGRWDLIEFSYQEEDVFTDYLDSYEEYYFCFEENNTGKIIQISKLSKIEHEYSFTYIISNDKKNLSISSEILKQTFTYNKGLFNNGKLIYDTGVVKTEAYWIEEGKIIETRTKIILKKV